MAGQSPRKLAVILHADVVESTRLVQVNEALAHERIRDAFHRFSDTIRSYGGTAHEIRGDALVAEFHRTSDAVAAALAFQAANDRFNTTCDDGVQPCLRIGIALGEVIIANHTVTGEGVVLAQRLEQLADTGGVCIQGAVQEAVPGRLPFEYRSLGERELKGIAEPVRVCAVTLRAGEILPEPERGAAASQSTRLLLIGAGAVVAILIGGSLLWLEPWRATDRIPPVDQPARSTLAQPSIAVLPFTNMSADPEQDYFVDGMTDDLITDLSKLSNLFVIARNSTFVYKGKSVDVAQVASELGVRYVLEGSIRRAANQVRINAQLIDGTTGGHVWADRYDGSLADVFALQDQITKRIVDALAITLTPRDSDQNVTVRTVSTAAHDAYLLGLSLYYRGTPEDNARAAVHLAKAIELDNSYSPAYIALAKVYARAVHRAEAYSDALAMPRGMGSLALTRIWELLGSAAITPDADYFVLQSTLSLQKRQHGVAVTQARRALDLNPNSVDAMEALSVALIYGGRIDEGLVHVESAMERSPIAIANALYLKGLANYIRGDLSRAIAFLQQAVELAPERTRFSAILAAAYADHGNVERASASYLVYGKGAYQEVMPNLTITSAWHPFSGRDVVQRFARNTVTAGAVDIGYFPLYAENRLDGTAIRSLLFGTKIEGTNLVNYEKWTQRRSADGEVEHSGNRIITGSASGGVHGFSRIDGDLLCERWPELNEVGEICVTLYRMPGSDSRATRRGDYVMVTDLGPMPFRISN